MKVWHIFQITGLPELVIRLVVNIMVQVCADIVVHEDCGLYEDCAFK